MFDVYENFLQILTITFSQIPNNFLQTLITFSQIPIESTLHSIKNSTFVAHPNMGLTVSKETHVMLLLDVT